MQLAVEDLIFIHSPKKQIKTNKNWSGGATQQKVAKGFFKVSLALFFFFSLQLLVLTYAR